MLAIQKFNVSGEVHRYMGKSADDWQATRHRPQHLLNSLAQRFKHKLSHSAT